MDQLPRLGKRELVFLLLFTCSFVVSVSWRFLFLLVPWDGLRFFIVAFPGPSVDYFTAGSPCGTSVFIFHMPCHLRKKTNSYLNDN